MVLQLIAVAPQAQMFFGAAEMILRTAPDPVIIRMHSCSIPHYPGHYFQRLGEWFHSSPSPSLLEDQATIACYVYYLRHTLGPAESVKALMSSGTQACGKATKGSTIRLAPLRTTFEVSFVSELSKVN